MRTELAGRLAKVLIAVFVGLLILMHFLRADLDPGKSVISEYAVGDHGWIMSLAFLCWAASCALLAKALWQHVKTKTGKVGTALLFVAAFGLILAALFETDPMAAAVENRTLHGKLHEIGAMLDLTFLSALLVPLGLRKNKDWVGKQRVMWFLAAVVWITQAIFMYSLAAFMHAESNQLESEMQIGWPSRIMLAGECLWLFMMAKFASEVTKRDN